MKKLFKLITGGLIKDISKVIDNLHTSEEERLQAKQKLQELLEQADKEAQDQVTERWTVSYTHLTLPTKRIV